MVRASVLILLFCTPTTVLAATDPRELVRKRGEVTSLILLPAVQRELGLSGEQKEKVVESARRLARTGASHEACDTDFAKLLDATQMKRLHEIRWQILDSEALFDPEVAARLKLTPEQARKLAEARTANDEAWDQLSQTIKRTKFRSPEQPRKLLDTYKEEANRRLLEVLTEDQRAKFREMKGPPAPPDLSGGS
jgi:hypothetical protein